MDSSQAVEKAGKTVLVIDDHEDTLGYIKLLLEARGYRIIVSANGRAALELYEQHKPNLVITDLFMPGFSGVELIEALLKRNPDLKIVVMSGAEDIPKRMEQLKQAMGYGAIRFLEKPVEPDILLDTVKRSLRVPPGLRMKPRGADPDE